MKHVQSLPTYQARRAVSGGAHSDLLEDLHASRATRSEEQGDHHAGAVVRAEYELSVLVGVVRVILWQCLLLEHHIET